MVTTELGACEWFVWDLRRSNLIDRGRLDQIVGDFLQKLPRAEPQALADFLVSQSIITQFQADRLLQGKTQGFVLGPFTLMDSLGAGSMGTVYKALNKTDNEWYAVKVLPRRSMWNVRIARRKVRSFEQCKHPTVVPFVDVGTTGGMHYLAWPYVEGETLDKIIARDGKLTPALTAHVGLQIAEALDLCHHHGLIHGLLKPSNIMLGAGNQVFILDFGIGCLLAETEGESLVDTMSTANSVTSGLDCASPESIMDPTNLTPAGDQYSLGCVLYYLLSGQYPFPDGSAAEKMMAHQFKQPKALTELNADVPADLLAVIDKLMQKAPESRYPSAGALVEALKPLANGSGPSPSRPVVRPSGAEAPTRIGATSVSTQTPRPQPGLQGLPTRNSLRGAGAPAAPAPAAPVAAPVVKPTPVRAADPIPVAAPVVPVPFKVPGLPEDDDLSWEERYGPAAITVATLALCALAFAAAIWFHIF